MSFPVEQHQLNAAEYHEATEKLENNIAAFLEKFAKILKEALNYKKVPLVQELETFLQAKMPENNTAVVSLHQFRDSTNYGISRMMVLFKDTELSTSHLLACLLQSYFFTIRKILIQVPPEVLEKCTKLINLNQKVMKTLTVLLKTRLIDGKRLETIAQAYIMFLLTTLIKFKIKELGRTSAVSYYLPFYLTSSFKLVPELDKCVIRAIKVFLMRVESFCENPGYKLQEVHYEILNLLLLLLRDFMHCNMQSANFAMEIALNKILLKLRSTFSKENYSMGIGLIDNILALF